jgi:hypothetical protein
MVSNSRSSFKFSFGLKMFLKAASRNNPTDRLVLIESSSYNTRLLFPQYNYLSGASYEMEISENAPIKSPKEFFPFGGFCFFIFYKIKQLVITKLRFMEQKAKFGYKGEAVRSYQ